MAMMNWEDRGDTGRAVPFTLARFRANWAEAVLAAGAIFFAAREWASLWRAVASWF